MQGYGSEGADAAAGQTAHIRRAQRAAEDALQSRREVGAAATTQKKRSKQRKLDSKLLKSPLFSSMSATIGVGGKKKKKRRKKRDD